MPRLPWHPNSEQIRLAPLLDCLSEPLRLVIVCHLAHAGPGNELRCSTFQTLSSKSNLSYHFANLRKAGIVRFRIIGTMRLMQLRRREIDERFPGLLDAILSAAARDMSN
jgi:DNA-binding transcriptional ArsR family regulator